ncbi:hypothetical protein ACQ4M3_13405 [Leptolyngbya sp. AN03gr2]|uniref:hypothetical protein n=1 Tax=unclassified Leptolyngbya TaxID=2650499 RepID=UPI003D318D08
MKFLRQMIVVTACSLISAEVGQFLLPAPVLARMCNPIGRIISGSGNNFSRGQIICAGDRLTPTSTAQMLCFSSRSLIRLRQGQSTTVNHRACPSQLAISLEPCQFGQSTQCFRAKGPEQNGFQLIEPSGTTVAEPRPPIVWQPVAGAREYTIRVTGPGVNWERTVRETVLNYPSGEPGLQSGNAYQIVVIARLPNRNLTTTRVVNQGHSERSNQQLRPSR